ncbi:hypothetical protein [Sulfitobacter geojensis]|uniref:hypothetical protein n=1 Tax=Sulfitobacter geojensis TaxID=1342299 RepID=UPI0004689D20|nr:hypothetical protein [Sulfitobacter geojensis]KHA52586.1 hypothetical protein Z947_2894 [Sulfitobacter geojensis]NYI28736.1 hypothetical protein [Sulfitobacter geojensis]
MRKAALVVLYLTVVALVTVPPLFAGFLTTMCMNPTGGACRTVTAKDWFAGELAGIWMPPFGVAIALILVIRWLHRKA